MVEFFCFLCGGRPSAAGRFVPNMDQQHKVNALPGMFGVVDYLLCKRCLKRADTPKAVEDKIFEEFTRQKRQTETN